jgi:Animal haem peroxidase
MPNSAVSRIELNQDGTINLVIDVYGFKPGQPVEISGTATQENGAVASFHRVQQMPQNGPVLVKGVSAVPGNNFARGFPVTIVARASEVWITTMAEDTALQSRVVSTPLQAAWNENTAQWAVSWPGQETPADWDSDSAPEPAPSTTLVRHGTWWDRVKREPLDAAMEGRFTRLFPYLPAARFEHADLVRLAEEMTAPPDDPVPGTQPDPEENPTIPAVYTYLSQFADHDLTFDPTSSLRESLTKAQLQALVDFRTPRLDLDNLYGRGPDDQPYMYEEDGIHMLLGEPMSGDPFDPGARQVPRGPNGRALTGDPRDDENRIISQLHSIFLRFHNKVADLFGRKKVSFADVRDQVRWHYQWILVNDFLPKIMEEQTYKSVFPDPYSRVPTIPRLREGDLELMPVEFSVAAYRFGHSMIRPRYRLNTTIERPIFSADPGATADLGGLRPIPSDWAIDWQFFIDLNHGAGPPAAGPAAGGPSSPVVRRPQLSYKIDTSLVNPLGHLPAAIATKPSSLALRDLERAVTFQLPSGQQVAEALSMPVIPDEELVIGKATAESPKKPITEIAPGFAGNAPLWTYILSEAQVTSWKNADRGLAKDEIPVKLGPLGGRLVAEVFASLLRGDPTCYLYAERKFKPIAAFTHDGTFGLAELINVALGRTP